MAHLTLREGEEMISVPRSDGTNWLVFTLPLSSGVCLPYSGFAQYFLRTKSVVQGHKNNYLSVEFFFVFTQSI